MRGQTVDVDLEAAIDPHPSSPLARRGRGAPRFITKHLAPVEGVEGRYRDLPEQGDTRGSNGLGVPQRVLGFGER
jgi:hypothetical protein